MRVQLQLDGGFASGMSPPLRMIRSGGVLTRIKRRVALLLWEVYFASANRPLVTVIRRLFFGGHRPQRMGCRNGSRGVKCFDARGPRPRRRNASQLDGASRSRAGNNHSSRSSRRSRESGFDATTSWRGTIRPAKQATRWVHSPPLRS
jgi:hypothetical protein